MGEGSLSDLWVKGAGHGNLLGIFYEFFMSGNDTAYLGAFFAARCR